MKIHLYKSNQTAASVLCSAVKRFGLQFLEELLNKHLQDFTVFRRLRTECTIKGWGHIIIVIGPEYIRLFVVSLLISSSSLFLYFYFFISLYFWSISLFSSFYFLILLINVYLFSSVFFLFHIILCFIILFPVLNKTSSLFCITCFAIILKSVNTASIWCFLLTFPEFLTENSEELNTDCCSTGIFLKSWLSVPLSLRLTLTNLSMNPDQVDLRFMENSGLRFEIRDLHFTAQLRREVNLQLWRTFSYETTNTFQLCS